MVLRGDGYEALGAVRLAHGTEGVWSEALGLYVCHRGWGQPRLHDLAAGRDLRTHGEETAARRVAEARAAGEAEARAGRRAGSAAVLGGCFGIATTGAGLKMARPRVA